MLAKKALSATAGAPKLYVEDVMSCFLYTGNGSTQTITNNIDLSTEGGLVWTKKRATGADNNYLFDTARGTNKVLYSDLTNGSDTWANSLTAYNANGFSLGSGGPNTNADTYASWTFRKAKKFFDVVTYTGNGTYPRDISHNLGSAPGCIIVKCTSNSSTDWFVYHRSLSVDGTNGPYRILLNSTAAQSTNDDWKNAPTSSVFTVNNSDVNLSGRTYVAYLFAHDAGGFGDAGSDNVITCGSYVANGNNTINLGYEPQWILEKRVSSAGDDWEITDNMRGFSMTNFKVLAPNTSAAEVSYGGFRQPTATGYINTYWGSGTIIYIAIRRGPMKTPETGTSVFEPSTTVNSAFPRFTSGFPVDWGFRRQNRNGSTIYIVGSRLIGDNYLDTASSGPEASSGGAVKFDSNTGWYNAASTTSPSISWMFRRAPGFFDVVCYTGTGSATTVSHNLGVVPELMIVKNRSSDRDWVVYNSTLSATQGFYLNQPDAAVTSSTFWNNTAPTSSVFTVNTNASVNGNGNNLVAYLFATVAGVSKVGSYTGNGSSVTVTTNFQPRFILVKRTDSTGDWIVSDSARGLVAGNDPYLELNTTDAEVTNEDWVDISSTSFTVNQTTNNANVNTGTYIYLAVS